MPRPWSRIGGWRLKYEQIPIRKVYNVLNRGMVLLRDVFSLNEYNFLKMISSNNSLPFMFDVYYGNESLLNLMQKNYEVGYRLFISTHGSFALKEIFDWLNSHPDVLVINTTSTLSANNYSRQLGVDILPHNLIRTAIPDNEMMLTLFNDIFLKLPSILKTNGQNDLYMPLRDTSDNTFPFNKIFYIHIQSGYTLGYLQSLTETINTLNLNVELNNFEIIVTEVNGVKNYELSDAAKFYLAENNISQSTYVSSTNKPLIILNCDPELKNKLIQLFNDIQYYDNYTLFSDSFATVFPTAYNFTAGLIHVGNFSRRGYILSSAVDTTQSINPFILNIFEILSNCGNFFKIFLNNSFIAKNLIDQLINIRVMQPNTWSDKNLIVSKIQRISTSLNLLDTSWKFEILFKKQNYIFEEIALIKSNSQLIQYPNKASDFSSELGTVRNIQENIVLNDLASTGTNINTILDNKYLINYDETYMVAYKNFLIQNFNKPLPEILFNHYILFTNVNTYNIPIKLLEPITIDVIVNSDDFLDITKLINIHIPEISYYAREYFYDSSNNYYVDGLATDFKNEATYDLMIDGSFNISVPLYESFNLIFFKGNVVRIGTNENNSFSVNKTVRGYVNQPININFLSIEYDYNIGDPVIVKQCAQKDVSGNCINFNEGVVTSVSTNKYTIGALFAEYIDPSGNTGNKTYNVTKSFTQPEIYSYDL
jgi:hypothetical protein